MARQFENSLDRFAQATSNMTFVVLTVGVLAVLFSGLVISIASQYWLVSVMFGLSVAGVLVFAIFTHRQQRKLQASKATGWIDWAAALPEIQRQNLTIAVGELSRILEVGSDSINDLQSAFIVAEDLALRQIQQEEQVPLLRHVSVASVPFDAVFTKGDILVCCEVSFLVSPELQQDRVVSMMKKVESVKNSIAEMNIGMNVRLMVILITQLTEDDLERLRATLGTKRFGLPPVDIDIRFLDFETLQRIYVTD
jgi:hypothetical protein